MMRRGAAILALLFLSVLLISAETRPRVVRSVRTMSIRAETVVLAEPIERSFPPHRFKVLEVLRGDSLKPGDTFALFDEQKRTVSVFDHNVPKRAMPQQGSEKPRRIEHIEGVEAALLFLGANRGSREQPRFQLFETGLCFWLRDGSVLGPDSPHPWGSAYNLVSRRDIEWANFVRQTRAEGVELNDLFARKNLRPVGRRNRALLEWIETHRHEFGAPISMEGSDNMALGWGDLETQVFQWVLDSCEPADCWAAVKLYAELNEGDVPPLLSPAFGSREGRALLLRIATSAEALEGDRLRALKALSDRQTTLWPEPSHRHARGEDLPEGELNEIIGEGVALNALYSRPTLWPEPLQRRTRILALQPEEQTEAVDRLQPLLSASSAPLRKAAARALRRISHPEDDKRKAMRSKRALPELVKAYHVEPPGEPRDELAEAVYLIGGAKHWTELTGNPPDMLVCLRDFRLQDQRVRFWLNVRSCGRRSYEPFTVLLERLEKGGKVIEKKQFAVAKDAMQLSWTKDQAYLIFEFSVKDYQPGTWRVGAHGTVGQDKEKRKWTAEPKTFVIEAPPRVNDGPSPFGLNW